LPVLTFSAIRRSVLVENIVGLHSVQVFTYVLPLVTVPFFARVLRPARWGVVALAQSYDQFLIAMAMSQAMSLVWLGVQWMLPLHCDVAFTSVVIGAGALNIGLAWILAPLLYAHGMAIAVVSPKACVTCGFLLYLKARSLSPLSSRLVTDAAFDAAGSGE
jgi:O-antigen/teichoic acid export membrane protein